MLFIASYGPIRRSIGDTPLWPRTPASYIVRGLSMEVTMTDSLYDQWLKELKILLDKIEHHPSADLDVERDRVAVLTTLIAKHARSTDVG
ncbi:hypothetical protein D3Y57_01595 (plasmid) [Sphingomonas paeninsulae]|uniref:Uncharacterized protein n=2 Tax=Sphingomonas paeninsulae TaxID=2319844 RepID=A0A494TH97_SPHPE|nr:hypothetical protein D3Y57_01595 [Sphingomonas paeninsulae]